MGSNPESADAPENPFEVKGLSTSRYERFVGKSGADPVFDRSPIEPYSSDKKQDRG